MGTFVRQISAYKRRWRSIFPHHILDSEFLQPIQAAMRHPLRMRTGSLRYFVPGSIRKTQLIHQRLPVFFKVRNHSIAKRLRRWRRVLVADRPVHMVVFQLFSLRQHGKYFPLRLHSLAQSLLHTDEFTQNRNQLVLPDRRRVVLQGPVEIIAACHIFRNNRNIPLHEGAQPSLPALHIHVIDPHFIALFVQFHVIPRGRSIPGHPNPHGINARKHLSAAVAEIKRMDNMPFFVHYQPRIQINRFPVQREYIVFSYSQIVLYGHLFRQRLLKVHVSSYQRVIHDAQQLTKSLCFLCKRCKRHPLSPFRHGLFFYCRLCGSTQKIHPHPRICGNSRPEQ